MSCLSQITSVSRHPFVASSIRGRSSGSSSSWMMSSRMNKRPPQPRLCIALLGQDNDPRPMTSGLSCHAVAHGPSRSQGETTTSLEDRGAERDSPCTLQLLAPLFACCLFLSGLFDVPRAHALLNSPNAQIARYRMGHACRTNRHMSSNAANISYEHDRGARCMDGYQGMDRWGVTRCETARRRVDPDLDPPSA